MCTKGLRNGLFCLLTLFLYSGYAPAQSVEQTESWQADEQIDIDLHALLGPVWQPVEFTPADRYGVPLFPLYKQEPAGAQGDFRPAPVPIPTSIPTSPSQPGPNTQPVQPQTPPAPPQPDAQKTMPQQPPPPPPPPAQPPCPIIYYDPNCVGP